MPCDGSRRSSCWGRNAVMGSSSGSTLLMYKRRKCESAFVRSSNSPLDTGFEEEHEEGPSSPLQLQTPGKLDRTGSCKSAVQVLKKTPDSKRTVAPVPAKRSRQLFLDLGQADFTHTTCRTCGLVYARGLESDEKLHKSFHRSQLKGIHFKGWSSERVAHHVSSSGDRVVYVLPGDPPGYVSKVQEIVKVMEQEMGLSPGWLWHKQDCKVYLFISASKKIVGCLVAERINSAFPIVPRRQEEFKSLDSHRISPTVSDFGRDSGELPPLSGVDSSQERPKPCKHILWGGWKFTREVVSRKKSQNDNPQELARAIMCSKTEVPAVCGVRGMWVSRSERRKGVATHLLDAMRKTFCLGLVLETSQCAFSQPSPDGEAFAVRYCGTPSFLVYHSSLST